MSTRTLATPAVIVGGDFFRGTYTGDGAATLAIVGVGFQPIVVLIYKRSNATVHTIMKTDQDATRAKVLSRLAYLYENDHIISLDADGFTVGDGTGGVANVCNIADQDYTYICFG